MTKRRNVLLAGLCGMAAHAARAATPDPAGGDPLGSPQWPGLRRKYTQDAPLRFTDAVLVRTPAFADDALNVPLQIDARALQAVGGGIARMVVIADRNPIREVLAFEPLQALPLLALRIRLEQASPVRCLVQTRDGHWHAGGAMAQAAGGGCTVPGVTRADGSWSKTLNQVHARFFGNLADGTRRLLVQLHAPPGLLRGVLQFEPFDVQRGHAGLFRRQPKQRCQRLGADGKPADRADARRRRIANDSLPPRLC